MSKQLLVELSRSFEPFRLTGVGLDVWIYLGGPWRHEQYTDSANHK